MTAEEVRQLIHQGEGTRVEFKEAATDVPSSFYETVCSFMNKEGGAVLLVPGWYQKGIRLPKLDWLAG